MVGYMGDKVWGGWRRVILYFLCFVVDFGFVFGSGGFRMYVVGLVGCYSKFDVGEVKYYFCWFMVWG